MGFGALEISESPIKDQTPTPESIGHTGPGAGVEAKLPRRASSCEKMKIDAQKIASSNNSSERGSAPKAGAYPE
jgi:hypothetical protein